MQMTSNSNKQGSSSFSLKKGLKNNNEFDLNLNAMTQGKELSNSANGPTLKGKVGALQEAIQQVADDLSEHRKNFDDLKDQKETIKINIFRKSDTVKKNLKNEVEKVEKEMDRHFSHQKAENSRLQQQITQLKTEKTVVQNQLMALQRRIADLELQIGEYDLSNK